MHPALIIGVMTKVLFKEINLCNYRHRRQVFSKKMFVLLVLKSNIYNNHMHECLSEKNLSNEKLHAQ